MMLKLVQYLGVLFVLDGVMGPGAVVGQPPMPINLKPGAKFIFEDMNNNIQLKGPPPKIFEIMNSSGVDGLTDIQLPDTLQWMRTANLEELKNISFDKPDIPTSGMNAPPPEEFLTDSTMGACEYAANNNYTITIGYHATNLTDPDFTSRQADWFMSLHPTLQTRKSPVVRKEIRQYTNREWSELKDAFWSIKEAMIDDLPMLEIFGVIHTSDISPSSTRAGPGQMGWHREYIIRFEEALRRFHPNVAVPYWDVTLEYDLPVYTDAVVWTDDLLGSCKTNKLTAPDGNLLTGPFANWSLPEYCGQEILTRRCGRSVDHHGFNQRELSYILNYTSFTDMYTTMGDCITRDHDMLHSFIHGTSLGKTQCVVLEPVSWLFHTFLDLIWELFRQDRQTTDLENDFPGEADNDYHLFEAPMYPFNIVNSDGMSLDYVRHFMTYQRPKTVCETESDCGATRWVWCDTEESRCRSKIRNGGTCAGNDNMCLRQATCNSNGRCAERRRNQGNQ